jgi:hypothetical protein
LCEITEYNKGVNIMKLFLLTISILLSSNIYSIDQIKGKYKVNDNDDAEYIYFYNNSYYYQINLCEGYSVIKGTFNQAGNKIVCKIIDKKLEGFKEDKLTEIAYEIINNTLKPITKSGCNISDNKYFIYTVTDYRKSKVNNLRIREFPNINSKIKASLRLDESVEIIDKSMKDKINGISGNWLLVKTNNNDFGYCFSGYLQ